jgi:hypothetical protein
MSLMWTYAEATGRDYWKAMSWAMLPSLGAAMCACTWHFFYNSPHLEVCPHPFGLPCLLSDHTKEVGGSHSRGTGALTQREWMCLQCCLHGTRVIPVDMSTFCRLDRSGAACLGCSSNFCAMQAQTGRNRQDRDRGLPTR